MSLSFRYFQQSAKNILVHVNMNGRRVAYSYYESVTVSFVYDVACRNLVKEFASRFVVTI